VDRTLAVATLSNHWYILDWESFEHNTAFVSSKEHDSFMAGMGQVFDLEVAAPLTSMTLPRCVSDLWS
jgi:hypothetical protein